MKLTISILMLLLVTITLNAQELSKKTFENRIGDVLFSFKENDNIITVQNYFEKKKSDGYLISILDESLNTITSFKKEGRTKLHHASLFNGNLYLFQQLDDRKKIRVKYFLSVIDITDFSVTERDLITLGNEYEETISQFFREMGSAHNNLGLFNSSNTYSSFSIELFKGNLKVKKHFFYDEEFNLIFEKEKEFPNSEKDHKFYHINSFINPENQSIVVVSDNYYSKSFKFEIITKDSYKSKNISFKKSIHYQLSITKSDKGVYCLGYTYNEESEVKNQIFYSHFSDNLDLIEEKYLDFQPEFIDKLGKNQKKDGLGISETRIIEKDNDLYFLGEVILDINSIGLNRSYSVFEDIIISKLTKDGNLKWSNIIKKRQEFEDSYRLSSYKPYIVNNKLTVFYNSKLKIEDIIVNNRRSSFFDRSNKFNLYAIIFDEEGDYVCKKITDKKLDFNYSMRKYSSKLGNSLLFYGRGLRKKERGLLKIDF